MKDDAVWVDDQPLPVIDPPRHSDARCFVVIGAGAAGSAAVATLLAHGFAGRLLWIDQERQPAYDRTALSKFVIAGQMAPDEVPALLEADALRKGQLERKHGKVRSLNSQKRQLMMPTASKSLTTPACWPAAARHCAPTSPASTCRACLPCARGRMPHRCWMQLSPASRR